MAADVPKIVLTSQERSHHFGRRECVANEPHKVGRSVDRRRIAPGNLIFDCRVLSRNHALMWYENGKFYIKDTKSSNGTFVNENRLSASGEESGPVEIKSRDVVQFGVNVNVDKKVTHGCIIATVKLYMNDVEVPGNQPPVQQALKMMQSALARELELEAKLASMQGVLSVAKELASDSMIAIVKEDELMSRLEMLENQLQVYSKNAADSELKKDLAKAFEDKYKNEQTAKESLRNMLQEKLECVSKLNQLQRDYDTAEQECQKCKMLYDTAKLNHSQEVAKLGEQLQTIEREKKDTESNLVEEKQTLSSNLESLQAEADFSKSQLEKTKTRLNKTEEELVELKIAMETERQRRGGPKDTLTESDVPLGAEDPLSSIVPPGTEMDPNITIVPPAKEKNISLILPPGTEDDPGSVSDRGVTPSEEVVARGFSPARPPSPFERRETIIASPFEAKPESIHEKDAEERNSLTGRLFYVEAELRVSQGRVKLLEEQLGVTSTSGSSSVAVSSSTEDLLLMAKRLSDTAITKGQIDVLHQSLIEAEKEIILLKGNQISHDALPDSQEEITVLKDKISSLQENLRSHQSRLQSSEIECKRLKVDNLRLENELSSMNDRHASESRRLESENERLVSENKELQRKISEDPANSNTSKHVQILTIIALVSIGVALASWVM